MEEIGLADALGGVDGDVEINALELAMIMNV